MAPKAFSAAVVGWQLWVYYMDTPWTRDGRVRADIVQVTPDVSGLVAEISVRNNQAVKKGDVLFRIDPIRPSSRCAKPRRCSPRRTRRRRKRCAR